MDIAFKDEVTVVILLGVSFTGAVNKHHRVDATGAGIFKESMGARNRGGIGLSYRPAGYIGWLYSFLGIDSWAP
jgi:hypothetical protein